VKQENYTIFLIENGYNPYTVYRWMLLDKLPEDIRFQVRQGEINQKTAVANGFERRQENDTTLAQGIKFSGIALIRRM